MGREAFESTVDAVAAQYQEWGVDGAEDKARREIAPRAERIDATPHQAPRRVIDPEAPLEAIPTKVASARVACDDRTNWQLEHATGNAPARASFSQPADRASAAAFQRRHEARMRERLGG